MNAVILNSGVLRTFETQPCNCDIAFTQFHKQDVITQAQYGQIPFYCSNKNN